MENQDIGITKRVVGLHFVSTSGLCECVCVCVSVSSV